MTNVRPWELNYDHYSSDKYDRDIVNSIPFHRELHEHIASFLAKFVREEKPLAILDLGTGTGITTKLVQDLLPSAQIDVVDFSEQMLNGAREKLGEKNIRYILGDYAKKKFDKAYDIVVSVISLHHQNNAGKKHMFKKIYRLLAPGGVFIFGDLVTHRDPHEAALNNALHLHHLVEHSTDQKTLTEWAHHHQFLNDLAPLEDQIDWLHDIGFKTKILLNKFNTALVIAEK